jgi:uncharacterized repeat protein (TIGR03806 family)
LAVFAAAPAAALCTGDCNGNGMVPINELIVGVNVALGATPVTACAAFDRNGDGEVRIDELLAGVGSANTGCPLDATPTPTATPVPGGETRCAVPAGPGVNFDPTQPFCELLSSYRFFTGDGSDQQPNGSVLPYDLNTPLFSDYAVKHRFVWMPEGVSASYHASESFSFPVGAVLIKTFAFPVRQSDDSVIERLIETRLLVRRATGWEPITYLWNAEQTEARRRIIGARVPITFATDDGTDRSLEFHVPNTNQCKECHDEHNGILSPLGPKARNLNKDYPYPDGVANQLARWSARGFLSGAPDPSQAPRAAVFDDPSSGTLDERARTYMDVNCGNCHNPSGLARTSGLYLNLQETVPARYGVCKGPVAAGQGTGGRRVDIFPGRPDESILVFRMESTAPGIAMPELGRQTTHDEALVVIREWIEGLPGTCELPD